MDILKAPLVPHHLGDKCYDTKMCQKVSTCVATRLRLRRGEVVTVGHLLKVVHDDEKGSLHFAWKITKEEKTAYALAKAIRKLYARAERQQEARYDGEAPTHTQMGDTYVGDGVERKPFYPANE